MVTIMRALGQVRKDLSKLLSNQAVEQACLEVNHTWRRRRLGPATTIHLFILQVLNRNTAMTHLPHLSGERFTASAYCQARQRLPAEVVGRVVDSFTRRIGRCNDGGRWHGHRVGLVDGSGFSMPDTPELQARFGQPGGQAPGCGFPVAHMTALFDAETGFLHDMILAPLRTHDMAQAAKLHPKLSAGDVVVGDRGFCSYAHLALISRASLHAVFRVHQRQIVDFRPHRKCAQDVTGSDRRGLPQSRWVVRLGRGDQLVKWRKPQTAPHWMTKEAFAHLPEESLVREIRYRITEPGCRLRRVTLVTTLLDPQRYPAADIAALYRKRWQVEVDLRALKNTLGMDVLKGHRVETVIKEALVFLLVYNLVRLVAFEAARRQGIHPRRISFIDALRWLQPPKPEVSLPALVVNPERPGRIEPRCIKRRMKPYKLMTRPRQELHKRLRKQRDVA